MKVEYFIIRDLNLQGRVHSDEAIAADAALAEQVRRDRFSITTLCPAETLGKLYCGCTNTGGDVLWEFDVRTNRFRTLNFAAVAEPDDVKIHRGLWLDLQRNSLFFGLATLSPVGTICTGRGARIMRFDLTAETYHELGRPSPGSYIQATAYDAKRQLMYSFTLPAFGFAVNELKTGRTRWHVPMESIVHVPTIDPAGGVWGTHSISDHAFFRYDPDADRFEFPDRCVMPTARAAANIMYVGGGPVDCMVTGPDGMVYVGSAMGELYRVDPVSKLVTYLARPLPFNRLPGLVFGPDARLYGVCGDQWHVTLFAYDPETGGVELFGELASGGRVCYRPHDLTYQAGRFFVAETDNPKQSGCLWALTV